MPDSFAIEPDPSGDVLVVAGGWTAEISAVLASGRVRGLVLNYARGFRERDLEMLRPWPIERLDVLARTLTDLTPIYRLAGTLRELSVTSSPRAALDCARLPNLTSLIASDWPQISATVARAQRLTHLGTGGYDEIDLRPLDGLTGLTSLRIKQAPGLAALGAAPGTLTSLEIFAAPGLQDIEEVGRLTALRHLWFRGCGGITALDDLATSTGLTELAVANCGPIASAGPLGGLTGLTRLNLSESTRITDGDLRPLLGLHHLQDLRMMNRRHYVPPLAAVKAALGIT
ncbi:hypothetical protein AB0C12_32800 [Actinoplanes sp. NPDC048967]|uniref:hypothetical protein n=1 Tax=Actinoplanes sp. NPDC048967 TaxID=3155269 RepID=UPI0033CA6AC8